MIGSTEISDSITQESNHFTVQLPSDLSSFGG